MNEKFDFRRINANVLKIANTYPSKHCNICIVLIKFFLRIVYYSFTERWSYRKVGRMLVMVPARNDQRSIKPILDKLKFRDFTYVDKHFGLVPIVLAYLYSIPYIPKFLRFYYQCSKAERIAVEQFYASIMATPGYYKVIDKFYEKNPDLELVVYSNDHVSWIRCLIERGLKHGVKSVYSQHASVTTLFPALDFSYSFLDGVETYETYKQCGSIRGEVVLAGSPRFDVALSLKHRNEGAVGIAFNQLDNLEMVVSVCEEARRMGYAHVVARPHPSMEKYRHDWSMFSNIGVELSFPSKEDPFPFLSRIELLIAGASSIHLEAALMGVPSVQYDFQIIRGRDYDCYGYLAKGLMTKASDLEDLRQKIKVAHVAPKELLQYYDAAYGTKWHGHSADVVAGIIDALLYGNVDNYLLSTCERCGDYLKLK